MVRKDQLEAEARGKILIRIIHNRKKNYVSTPYAVRKWLTGFEFRGSPFLYTPEIYCLIT